jgi:putative peptidoglycan lipid II flippase
MNERREPRPEGTGAVSSTIPVDGIAGDSMTVAGWTIASRVTGFFRFAAIAAVLGPTFFGNLFEATNILPNLAFELLTGPLIAALLVPHLVRLIDARQGRSEQRLAGGFLGVLLLVFTGTIVIVIAAGPLVLGLLTILVPDSGVRTDQLNIGWPLLAMLMPQALFYAIAATGAAVQNAHGKFALAAAAPALENIGIIVVMGVSAVVYGMGLEVNEVSTSQLLLLGLGTTGAVALHAGAQWWGARRVGITLIPAAGWRDPEVRKILRLAIPSTGFAALTAVRTIGLLVAVGSLPGGVIAFQLGRYFFNFPVAIAARPVIAAQLPRLSRTFNEHDDGEFVSTYRRGVNLIMFVAVPASLLMIVLAGPLARAATYGEMASTDGIALAAVAIGTLAAGVVGESLFLTATSAFYARRNARAPLIATALRLGLTLIGTVLAVTTGEGIALLVIIGLSVALSDLIAGFGLHGALQRALPQPLEVSRLSDRYANVVIAALSVAAGAAVTTLTATMTLPGRFTEAVVGATTIAAVYLTMQRFRRSPELEELVAVFRRPADA